MLRIHHHLVHVRAVYYGGDGEKKNWGNDLKNLKASLIRDDLLKAAFSEN